MKTDIHPKYHVCEVSCVCGNLFTTRSTRPSIKVEICAACHPFYTGKQKMLDTAGRVERFQKKFASTGGKTVERKLKVAAKTSLAPKHTVKRVLSSTPTKKVADKAAAPKAAPKAEKKPEAK